MLGAGPLPSSSGKKWVRLGDSSGGIREVIPGLACDYCAVGDGCAITYTGGATSLVQSLDADKVEDDVDARVLPILEDGGVRNRSYRDPVKELTQTTWPGWPVLGPRTTRWVARFIGEHTCGRRVPCSRTV